MKELLILIFLNISIFAHFDEKDLKIFEQKCMVCHATYIKNNLAPPIIAINQRYKKFYGKDNLELSVVKIKDFLMMPTKEKSILKPAVKLYGLMPKQDLNEKEIEAFSEIIMLLDYEIPDWFDKHYNSHDLDDKKKNKIP